MYFQFNIRILCFSIYACIFLILSSYSDVNYVTCDMEHFEPQSLNGTLLEMARLMVKVEMWKSDYNYSHSGVDKLEDLVMESGGTPIRSIIVSTWRSGSSFLSDLINAVPASFYSYEPLKIFGVVQMTGPPIVDKAVTFMKNILTCKYSIKMDLRKYFAVTKNNKFKFEYNKRYWNICGIMKKFCFDADFAAKFCKLFPFHIVNMVRMKLPLFQTILKQDKLNVKVVLLVRDPRGVMCSRNHFCNVRACSATTLCANMIIDYNAVVKLLPIYPDRIMVLRFEDLAFNLKETTLKLFKFLRLQYTQSVQEFLDTHTNVTDSDIFSTFRITKDIPLKWTKVMPFSDVHKIQETCKEAMSLWGYKHAYNASHMTSKDFDPLLPYIYSC